MFAFGLSAALGMPASRELMLKLGTLVDWARRENPELYKTQIEPISPFVNGKFVHKRITSMLKADMTPFGEVCVRLQREAKKFDRKAHVAMIPAVAYLLGLGVWFVVRR